MSNESTWRSAWNWAGEWRGTTSFWIAEVLVGGIAFLTGWLVTGDLNWAVAATGLGAFLVFASAFVIRVWRVHLKERREFRQAIISFTHSSITTSAEPSAPSQKAENQQRFTTYVDNQLVKMIEAQASLAGGDLRAWDHFLALAWRTADGIRRFDESLGTYVDNTIEQVKDLVRVEDGADRIIDAVLETKALYDGRDPTVIATF